MNEPKGEETIFAEALRLPPEERAAYLAQAEPLIRECLAFRQKERPDDWLTFATQSLLGAILLKQQSYADAERLLLSSFERMERHQDKAPSEMKQVFHRLIQLYESTEREAAATEWKRKLSEFDNAETKKKAAGQEPKR